MRHALASLICRFSSRVASVGVCGVFRLVFFAVSVFFVAIIFATEIAASTESYCGDHMSIHTTRPNQALI
jgi:hypothetical protein